MFSNATRSSYYKDYISISRSSHDEITSGDDLKQNNQAETSSTTGLFTREGNGVIFTVCVCAWPSSSDPVAQLVCLDERVAADDGDNAGRRFGSRSRTRDPRTGGAWCSRSCRTCSCSTDYRLSAAFLTCSAQSLASIFRISASVSAAGAAVVGSTTTASFSLGAGFCTRPLTFR
jgi:hypothetical protein